MVSLAVVGVLVVSCVIGPILLPPDTVNLNIVNLPILSGGHILGTDLEGRDVLVRLLDGGRISLLVGVAAMLVTLTLALVIGMLSGYAGKAVDSALTPITNVFLSIPSLMILVLFGVIFGHGIQTVVIGIGILSWPYPARVIRSVTLSLREAQYIEAAHALGVAPARILVRHLLPNMLGPVMVSASLAIANAILTESSLSFLGLGINPPTATWGYLLNEGRDRLDSVGGFVFELWPGLLILVTVLAFNYIGSALNDAFDPRSSRDSGSPAE
jgi:ABC-type dipeptide/oligopeptide/nickel transport system permease subunit